MFLSGLEILDRLDRGDLVVDPLLFRSQVDAVSIDLHLGTDYLSLPVDMPPDEFANFTSRERPRVVTLGEGVAIEPGAGLLCSTLEFVKLPADLGGLLFPRSSLWRVGAMTSSSMVHPGFAGKLVLPLYNMGSIPIELRSGVRVVKLAVFPAADTGMPPGDSIETEIEKLKVLLRHQAEALISEYKPRQSLKELLDKVLGSSSDSKGQALETFMIEVLKTIRGINIIKVNARLSAEEIDIYLQNDLTHGFWRFAGSPIIVECKNWSAKVPAHQISILYDKMKSVGPDAKTGILVAPNGVTGKDWTDAKLKIREKRIEGRNIILLEREDLSEIAEGKSAVEVIEARYGQLLLL